MSSPVRVSASLLNSGLVRAGAPSAVEVAACFAVAAGVRAAKVRSAPALGFVARQGYGFDRRLQRSSDREASVRRRRTLGGSGNMPATIRCCYTEGERAALNVIALEARRAGCCDLPIDRLAAVAGVSRTTVQNALRRARSLGHVTIEHRPRRGAKSLTNIVRIVSPEWLDWLSKGGRAAESIGFKALNPTKTIHQNKAVSCRGKADEWLGEKVLRRRFSPVRAGGVT